MRKKWIVSLTILSLALVSCIQVRGPRAIELSTIKSIDLTIEFEDGVSADAQLTYPAVGEGPFPGVLLIPGSGSVDMDEFIPGPFTGTGEPSRPMLQVAETLSNRGFAVLRYNKRNVGLGGVILDPEITHSPEIEVLINDAESAWETLQTHPLVESEDLSIVGHSEGGVIAIHLSVDNPDVDRLILLSTIGVDARSLIEWQLIDQKLSFAEMMIDSDGDGEMSLSEVEGFSEVKDSNTPLVSIINPQNLVFVEGESLNLHPAIDTDRSGSIDIDAELAPILKQNFELVTMDDEESPYYDPWLHSAFALEPNTELIRKVSSRLLLVQGLGDIQTPPESSYILFQNAMSGGNKDVSIKTYDGLGHTFSPTYGMIQPLGPIEGIVLDDIGDWITEDSSETGNIEGSEIPRLSTRLNKSMVMSSFAIVISIVAIVSGFQRKRF